MLMTPRIALQIKSPTDQISHTFVWGYIFYVSASSTAKSMAEVHLVPLKRSNPVTTGAITEHRLPIFACTCQKISIRSNWTAQEVRMSSALV